MHLISVYIGLAGIAMLVIGLLLARREYNRCGLELYKMRAYAAGLAYYLQRLGLGEGRHPMLESIAALNRLYHAVKEHHAAQRLDRCWRNDIELWVQCGFEPPESLDLPPRTNDSSN